MRRAVGFVALVVLMVLLHRLTDAGPVEARATLALGFLLLVALLAGDIAVRYGMPRLIGAFLFGFFIGPAWLGLVRPDELGTLRLLEDGALVLIALAAGSRLVLRGPSWRDERPAMARLAAGAIALPLVAVSLVMLSVAPWFPLTHHQPLRDGATVALTLGALAVVSSPFVLQAVMADAGSRGPIGDRLVRFAALQDLAGAVLVIPVLIAGRALGSPGGVDIRPAWTWAAQLAGSILAGGVVGVALARAARAIPNDDALVALVAIIALGVAVIGDVSGLEPAIVALAAGATLATWHTVDTERLRGILDRLLAPVVLVWFAMTGAGLRISILRDRDLWPWALLYAGVRYVSLRTGMRWAGRSAMVPPGLARAAPSALVVQGGIAVVLAQVARRAYPEWGVSLAAFIVAIIGVHEVVGAIAFRRALVRAGEVLEEQHVGAEPTLADAVPPQ